MTNAMNEFLNALRLDEILANGLAVAIEDRADVEGADAVMEYASEHGFTVSRDEAEALKNVMSAYEGALSGDQLDRVAGGRGSSFFHGFRA